MHMSILTCGAILWGALSGCAQGSPKETHEPPTTTNRRERPEDEKASTTQQAEKGWILGTYDLRLTTRITIDDGLSALVLEQCVGEIPFVLVSQRDYHREMGKPSFAGGFPPSHPCPKIPVEFRAVILLKGRFVTEELWTLDYAVWTSVDAGEKRRAVVMKTLTYFLADDDVQCKDVSTTLSENRKRIDVMFEGDCLPASIQDARIALEHNLNSSNPSSHTVRKLEKNRTTRISLDLSNIPTERDLSWGLSMTNVNYLTRNNWFTLVQPESLPRGIVSILVPMDMAQFCRGQ